MWDGALRYADGAAEAGGGTIQGLRLCVTLAGALRMRAAFASARVCCTDGVRRIQREAASGRLSPRWSGLPYAPLRGFAPRLARGAAQLAGRSAYQ